MPALTAFSCVRPTTNVDHGVDVRDRRRVEIDLLGEVHRAAVDNQAPAALLADVGEDHVEVLPVPLEDRRAYLDLGALRERQDRLEDLAGGPARRRLVRARAAGLADRERSSLISPTSASSAAVKLSCIGPGRRSSPARGRSSRPFSAGAWRTTRCGRGPTSTTWPCSRALGLDRQRRAVLRRCRQGTARRPSVSSIDTPQGSVRNALAMPAPDFR